MIPLRDNIPSRTTPFVNYAVIAVCALLFALQLANPQLIEQLGMIPARVLHPSEPVTLREPVIVETPDGAVQEFRERTAAESPLPAWMTLLTCIFLHGGWLHFLGNMWFLYIFGDNVEDCFGHMGYLAFYLGCGVAASVAHLLTNLSNSVPTIGASGAIAGVMGAYFLLYPRARVLAAVPIFLWIEILVVPAPLFLGIWFLIQFFLGTFALTSTQSGGVAWWAHIGGFVAGLTVAWQLRKHKWLKAAVTDVLPQTDRLNRFRFRQPQ